MPRLDAGIHSFLGGTVRRRPLLFGHHKAYFNSQPLMDGGELNDEIYRVDNVQSVSIS
jgi:hypothetical protein